MPLPKAIITNTPTQITSACYAGMGNKRGYATVAYNDFTLCGLPTVTSQFAAGCILINDSASAAVTSTTAVWVNLGSATTPSWTVLTIS